MNDKVLILKTMKTILDKKVTGSIYKGITWREFADKVITDLIPNYVQPIVYDYAPDTIFDMEHKRFGKGDSFWKVPNTLPELKSRFETMDKNCFAISIGDKGRTHTTKVPREVIEIVIGQINIE